MSLLQRQISALKLINLLVWAVVAIGATVFATFAFPADARGDKWDNVNPYITEPDAFDGRRDARLGIRSYNDEYRSAEYLIGYTDERESMRDDELRDELEDRDDWD